MTCAASSRALSLTAERARSRSHDVRDRVPWTLLQGVAGCSSGLGVACGLEVGERVVELGLLAEHVSWAQPDAAIDARNRVVGPSSDGVCCSQYSMRVSEVRACFDFAVLWRGSTVAGFRVALGVC
jgi:hypothetical protein